ncbi:MAG: MFS transporter [Pirellulaceae bacterium]|nr:MAG: MFS transporter [Pirellulaceae bacterium]
MIVRFCLYSVVKNLRFANPFLPIYLLELGFSYAQIGAMLGFERLVTGLLEVPSGYGADYWGRRTVLAWSFACHATGLLVIALAAGFGALHPIWFYVGLGIFGVGEAFRTGSHKAIMLDYLQLQGLRAETTAILALARTFSKSSSALAGVAAGLLLYFFQDYVILFWLSAFAGATGCLLILSYPKSLEGEVSRQRSALGETRHGEAYKVPNLLRNKRLWPVLGQSLIYESQVEVILKFFLQPFLYQGLSSIGYSFPTAGGKSVQTTGAILIGINEMFRDMLGAIGASFSGRAERRFRHRSTGVNFIHLATTAVVAVLGFTTIHPVKLLPVGLVAIGATTFLQNLRRPMFVSLMDEVANRPLRATILSLDSQARSLTVAVQLPLMGIAADTWGLWTVVCFSSLLMMVGLVQFSAYSPKCYDY